MGLELRVFNASTLNELDAAFVALAQQRPDALMVGADPFFVNQREQLTASAARIARAGDLPVPRVPANRRPRELWRQPRVWATAKLASMPAAFSRATNPPISRSCSRQLSSWLSISRQQWH